MGLEVFERLEDLRRWRAATDSSTGPSTVLVPTMGNLHTGHLALIEHARSIGDRVIASIFVNPTQFGPNEDYQRYPRTPAEDLDRLQRAGCDAVWMPDVETMYPAGPAGGFGVHVPAALADCLCGAHRPGHFDGVASAVMRLFWQVRPERAVFGEKDWQQLVIIRALVREFSIPVAIE
ncbi:MAG: 4-phosphopantoate--beta-alanine ligase, partial [Wenzhouxiangellaceae bacterium]